ncbi:MAG: aminotransferase class IV [Pirellulales bacterium]
MTEPTAYFDGRFVPQSAARIAPTDAGFVQGITVSEHLRTFRGKLFRLDEHWLRLRCSLEIVGTRPTETLADLSFAAEQVAKHNHALLTAGDDLGVVVAVTPGSSPAYSRIASDGPNVLIHSYPLPFKNWADGYRAGVRLRIAPQRQVPSSSWPSELKCRSRMHYHLADRWAAAQEPGARALLLDEHGMVNETSTANVLLVRGDTLIGQPARDDSRRRQFACDDRVRKPDEVQLRTTPDLPAGSIRRG